MVRLKDRKRNSIYLALLFQFQYGAIEGFDVNIVAHVCAKFQFQYGAIEGEQVVNGCCKGFKFQFQYGAIEGGSVFR